MNDRSQEGISGNSEGYETKKSPAPSYEVIRLPDEGDFVLSSWKASSGSAVRKGETVAVLVRRGHSSNDSQSPTIEGVRDGSADAPSTAETSPQPTSHKRPTRKRKPAAVTELTGPASSQTPNSTSDNTSKDAPSSSTSDSVARISKALNLTPPGSSAQTSKITLPASAGTLPLVAPIDGILKIGAPVGCGDDRVKGYVEKCSHPTVVVGLCAVCGQTVEVNTSAAGSRGGSGDHEGPSQSETPMSRMTISGGITVSVSQEEGQLIAQQDAQRLRKLRKLSLVLDLDHTLVHATWDGQAQQQVHHADVRSLLLSVPVMEGDVRREIRMQHFVKLRPNLKAFLSKCQARYEFGVYTAGTRDYAEEVTLILARHLVGADRDEIDLERLRQAVAQAELDLQRKAKTADAKSDKSATAQGKASSGEGTAGANADTVNGASSEGGNSEELSRKRKRVAFGEPPAEQKTDELTPQALADLKRELEEAEAQEARAVEAKQRLFGSRVVSRTDVGDLGRDVKSLRRIFPCGGTMAAVVDDREDVWANAQDQVTSTDQRKRPGEPPDNLLLVRPYHWDTFLGFADVNNASGADLSSSSPADSKPSSSPKRGSSESDQQLLWTSDVLMRLHERYYQHNNESGDDAARPSVPEILASMRREVLRGCNVVLSGLIPIHKQNSAAESDRPRPPIVRYVEDLGGRILNSVMSEATHVVAAKDGTDKIVAARKVPGCVVVKTAWLMECVWSLTRRDELQHVLGPAPRPVPANGSQVRPLAESKRENSSASSDDDEDDEFAAELESDFL